MMLPDYWLSRPALELDRGTRTAFDQWLASARSVGGNPLLDYPFANPKWQFLCYLAEHQQIALHGSGNGNISTFEPRQSNDLNEFGNRKAVYAAGDGIWAMFFAIADRERFPMSINNASISLVDAKGQVNGPFYVFSVSREALAQRPWRTGTVYLLPRDTFVEQSPLPFGEYEVHVPQLASLTEVTPIARLEVSPEDFPFLSQIRGHDDSRLQEYGTALQTGGLWPKD